MNGNAVRNWAHIAGYPVTILPGGYVMGGTVGRVTKQYTHHIGSDDLVQEDWEGNVVWSFGKADEVEVDGKRSRSARQNRESHQRRPRHHRLHHLVALRVGAGPEGTKVRADLDLACQVLLGLVANAAEATTEG